MSRIKSLMHCSSEIKMQDAESSKSNNEITNNVESGGEKNNAVSPKSVNGSDLSFIVLSECESEKPNISTNISSSESNFNEKKISSILRENFKLKEMFRNQNNSTRKQLNTMIVLEKEIRQICENYKQRFLEAADLINQLKEYNSPLKATPAFNEATENKITNSMPTSRELNLIGQLRDLSRQLKDSQENYSRSQLKIKEMENKFTVEVDNFNETLRKLQEELKTLKEKTAYPSPKDLLVSMNRHCKSELETKYLIELTAILKQSLDEKKLIEAETDDTNNYKEKLHDLFKCFTKHCADSLNVENFPDECNNLLQGFKNVEIPCNEDFADELRSQDGVFFNYKNALIDDQLRCIKDESTLKNIQVEFLKVYSDYINISHIMECLKNEDFKKKDKKIAVTETNVNSTTLAEIEKCLLEEKKNIECERIKMSEERSNIEEEKQNMREERELFDAERIALLEEKEFIIQENKDIIHENLFLNQEVEKLKKELSKRKENTSLQEELEMVKAQFNDAKEKLKISLETNSELSEEITKMLDKEEDIWAYKMQVEEQQNEFHVMHQAEQNFLQQIQNLSYEIRELREENARLRQRNNEIQDG